MTDLRKAAQMALEALEFNDPLIEDFGSKEQLKSHNEAIVALYKTLAQSEQATVESVYEIIVKWDEGGGKRSRRELARRIVELYTTLHSAKGSADSAEGFGKPEQNHLSDAMSVLADVNADLIAEAKLAQPEQEPVHFLANGVRYKVTHQGYYGCSIVGLPENLNGQWVALVEATDSKHLNCIAPQESTKPEQKPIAWITRRTGDGGVVIGGYETCEFTDYDAIPVYTAPPKREWVGLTDEQLSETYNDLYTQYTRDDVNIADFILIARAVETKLKELNT